ncbi:MAG: tryptophan dimethylallyltransferase [Pseudonocardia sp.]|nr:tryptophan dimethylallyltransferase [Pseudonocardia sp.]
MSPISLYDHTARQLRDLCAQYGLGESTEVAVAEFRELLGPGAGRPISESPAWRSEVADDHTPVEFSIAFSQRGRPVVRVLVEPVAQQPDPESMTNLAESLLQTLSDRHGLPLDRYCRLRDLFLGQRPREPFGLWFSLVLCPHAQPAFKIYFNPQAHGPEHAYDLVHESMHRLDLGAAYPVLAMHTLRRGHELDKPSFFALDLSADADARIKVYVSHLEAGASDVEAVAQGGRRVPPGVLREFCQIAGGAAGPFTNRPLISSYAFIASDTDRPSGYSLYLPIRDYVPDDAVAQCRVRDVLGRAGLDRDILDRALSAVTNRPLDAGVGLIAHVSLRMGRLRPGVTVYLSSEAYRVTPPRSMPRRWANAAT